MKLRNYLIAGTLTLAFSGAALAAVTAEEAKKLGTTLTPIGAEKAGNKEGTIPEYTGGLTTAPAGYVKGSGRYVDPFKDEKPLFSITKENMSKYADKLTTGTRDLLNQKPGFRIDVYKTHRTANFPEYVEQGTKKAATTAQLAKDGNSFTGAVTAFPFPIPKNGAEALWNHAVRYRGESNFMKDATIWVIDASGRQNLASGGDWHTEQPYWYKKNATKDPYVVFLDYVYEPPRSAGQKYMVFDSSTPGKPPRVAWQYLVGQRRVKNAPDMAYDAPNPTIAGGCTSDDSYIFNGPTDRWDWKLVGKKEMYIPYNTYKLSFDTTPAELFKQKYMNPDLVRWELHRVWVVEATLKPGKRHLYSRRTYYIDEDSWAALASDAYDGKGKMYRVGFAYMFQAYDVGVPNNENFGHYDLIAGGYALGPALFKKGKFFSQPPLPAKTWNPETLAEGAR